MSTWRWYVYELADPRDGRAFYVGKGQGKRIAEHEKDAERLPVCSEKLNKIRDIWASGAEVERRFVAYFKDEAAAYAYEAERIASYGLEALTNILPGGGAVREHGYVGSHEGWKPLEAAELLAGKPVGLDWLAIYLKAKSGGQAVRLEGNRLQVAIGRAILESFMPMCWDAIKTSRRALDVVAPLLEPRGVKVEYGGA